MKPTIGEGGDFKSSELPRSNAGSAPARTMALGRGGFVGNRRSFTSDERTQEGPAASAHGGHTQAASKDTSEPQHSDTAQYSLWPAHVTANVVRSVLRRAAFPRFVDMGKRSSEAAHRPRLSSRHRWAGGFIGRPSAHHRATPSSTPAQAQAIQQRAAACPSPTKTSATRTHASAPPARHLPATCPPPRRGPRGPPRRHGHRPAQCTVHIYAPGARQPARRAPPRTACPALVARPLVSPAPAPCRAHPPSTPRGVLRHGGSARTAHRLHTGPDCAHKHQTHTHTHTDKQEIGVILQGCARRPRGRRRRANKCAACLMRGTQTADGRQSESQRKERGGPARAGVYRCVIHEKKAAPARATDARALSPGWPWPSCRSWPGGAPTG